MWTVPPVTQQWYQDVLEVVNEGIPALAANATDVQQAAHKELKKKGEHDKVMDSHLRGSVVCKCELYVPHRIKQ